jgi:hypothetical protein
MVVKPKFKAGDWVRTRAFIWKIVELNRGQYYTLCHGSILHTVTPWPVILDFETVDKDCRKLTEEEKALLL